MSASALVAVTYLFNQSSELSIQSFCIKYVFALMLLFDRISVNLQLKTNIVVLLASLVSVLFLVSFSHKQYMSVYGT